LAVLVVLVIFGVRGYHRGLTQEALEALACVAGLVIAVRLSPRAASLTSLYSGIPTAVTRPVLLVAIALGVAAIGYALAGWVRGAADAHGPWRRIDGWGGLGFGVAKGALITSVLLVLAAQVPWGPVISAVDGSMIARALYAIMPAFYRHLDRWLVELSL